MGTDRRPVLHVCLSCVRAGTITAPGEAPAGTRLSEAVAAALDAAGAASEIRLNPVTCMANCENGCTAAVSAPGKWSYVLGALAPGLAADLVLYARAYDASKSGVVLPSKRPESLRHVIVARVPAHPDQLIEQEVT